MDGCSNKKDEQMSGLTMKETQKVSKVQVGVSVTAIPETDPEGSGPVNGVITWRFTMIGFYWETVKEEVRPS